MTDNAKMKFPFFHILRIFNTLSLDVVIGSVLCAIFVSTLITVDPGWAFWIILPTSVWIIYTLDHLIDANRLKQQASTFRHRFHFTHRKILFATINILIVGSISIIFYGLKKPIIYFGAVLSLFTIIYLSYIYLAGGKSLKISKEIFVSVIYTLGIWGGPLSLIKLKMDTGLLILFIAFFLLVIADILILSYFEIEQDKKDKHSTVAVNYGKRKVKQIIIALITIIFLLNIYLIIFEELELHRVAAKIFILMAMILIILISFPKSFKKNDIYRNVVENLFWIPGLLII